MRLMRRLLWFCCLLTAGIALAEAPVLENGSLRLVFDEADGRLVEIEGAGHSFLQANDPEQGLWEIIFLEAGIAPVAPVQAKDFEWQRNDRGEIELRWRDFGIGAAPGLEVVATFGLEANEAVAYGGIRLENLGTLTPAMVCFPRVHAIAPQEGEVLATPVWMGEKTDQFRGMLNPGNGGTRRFEWEYPGLLSLQCLTLYRENGPGLYLAADDTAALRKHFAAFGDGRGGVGLETIQFPVVSEETPAGYVAPYRVLLGTFEGDWLTVAERYRAWALEQAPARGSRLRNDLVADWVLDTGLWVWNRGRSEGVLEPARVLQEEAGMPVSVFWHWWHGCAYDVGFPEYLPPREGTEAFQAAMERAQAQGLHAIVYMNQRLWGMTTESWREEGAERYAVKGRDGTIRPEVYNTFTKSPCASMCMGTAFWRNKYAGLAASALNDLRVNGIYMDQACSSLACYDPTHGHPLGGGRYWMEGFQALAADIRQRADARPIALAGEGTGEAWLPHLDLMLSLQVSMERYAAPGLWEPIPFFHAVYHGYAVFFGNYASLTMPPYDELWPEETAPESPLALLDRKYAAQFRLEQARAFLWGQQPTLANFRPAHLNERREELDFVLRLARLRRDHLQYFLHGTMLRAPNINAPEETIDMSRLSIYAGQQGALQEYRKGYPMVHAAAWRAPEGGAALAMVNIAATPQSLDFTVDTGSWGIADNGLVFRVDGSGRQRIGEYRNGQLHLQAEMPGEGVWIYEFTHE